MPFWAGLEVTPHLKEVELESLGCSLRIQCSFGNSFHSFTGVSSTIAWMKYRGFIKVHNQAIDPGSDWK